MHKTIGKISGLLIMALVLFLSVSPVIAAQSFSIDFRNSTGSPTQNNDEYQINGIGFDIPVVNPLTGATVTTHMDGNILWKFDYTCLCLKPIGVSTPDTQCNNAGLKLVVTDALTGNPISGASVTVAGSTVTSNASGIATFSNLTANTNNTGNSISVTVSASGYTSQTTTVTIACNLVTEQGIALLSSTDPGANRGDIRIILSWGLNPADLDSHLTGPKTSGADRFHIYYSARNNCSSAPCDAAISAWLDVDDVTSYGPETITILASTMPDGVYRYTVHHYTGTSNIPDSGASVKVYQGSSLVRTYTPPADSAATGKWAWTVFEMTVTGGSVSFTEVGTYYLANSSGSSVLMTFPNSIGVDVSNEDPSIFMEMPSK